MDYAELLWEGIYYSLHHPTSSIPYPRFTKIIVSHYMTIFPEISRRARDMYQNLQDNDIMKNIFNSGRHKDKVGMQIMDWMITEEMKHTEHYRMYAEVFGLDVPLTQSQPTESTQVTHRTPSALRSPTPKKDTTESSAPKRSTVIHFRLSERRSTRLTPPAPVPTVDKADEMILQDTLQVSLAEHKSREEQEARENVELVNKHLASEEIEKKWLEPRSDKESPEVEITNDKEVEITNVVISVNVNEEEDEITNEANIQAEISLQIQKAIDNHIPTQVDASVRSYMSGHILHLQRQDIAIWLALQMKFENLQNSAKQQKTSEYEAYVSGETSSGQVNEEEQGQSTTCNQEQEDDYDFWTDSYASDDDEIPSKCTSGDEHQYHIDQMKNFLKSDIVWESRKEILVSPHPRKTTPLVQSCQRDPEALALSL
ncbi:hypothetical protein Tco_0978126, partial [Tanacetum coccineum]